jgi:hypothetical protein
MSLDASSSNLGASGGYRDLDAEEFTRHLCSVIRTGRVGITHLVLRKATNVYLTQQRPRYVLMHLAEALEGNESLVRCLGLPILNIKLIGGDRNTSS